MKIITVGVAKHLDFNMAGSGHEFFNQHKVIGKGVFGLPFGARQGVLEIRRLVDNPHAFTAAARGRFY